MNEPKPTEQGAIAVRSSVLLGCCELHTDKEKREYNTCPICLWHIHKNACAERDYLKTQSSENCLEWQDWERWMEEVLKDFKIPFDPHKYGMRGALTQWMREQRTDDRYTYTSKQATCCAVCGKHKHTPLRNDEMGGYVCLTCIDQELERLQSAAKQPNDQAQRRPDTNV